MPNHGIRFQLRGSEKPPFLGNILDTICCQLGNYMVQQLCSKHLCSSPNHFQPDTFFFVSMSFMVCIAAFASFSSQNDGCHFGNGCRFHKHKLVSQRHGNYGTGILGRSPETIPHFRCEFFRQVCFEIILANMSGFVWIFELFWICFVFSLYYISDFVAMLQSPAVPNPIFYRIASIFWPWNGRWPQEASNATMIRPHGNSLTGKTAFQNQQFWMVKKYLKSIFERHPR